MAYQQTYYIDISRTTLIYLSTKSIFHECSWQVPRCSGIGVVAFLEVILVWINIYFLWACFITWFSIFSLDWKGHLPCQNLCMVAWTKALPGARQDCPSKTAFCIILMWSYFVVLFHMWTWLYWEQSCWANIRQTIFVQVLFTWNIELFLTPISDHTR